MNLVTTLGLAINVAMWQLSSTCKVHMHEGHGLRAKREILYVNHFRVVFVFINAIAISFFIIVYILEDHKRRLMFQW